MHNILWLSKSNVPWITYDCKIQHSISVWMKAKFWLLLIKSHVLLWCKFQRWKITTSYFEIRSKIAVLSSVLATFPFYCSLLSCTPLLSSFKRWLQELGVGVSGVAFQVKLSKKQQLFSKSCSQGQTKGGGLHPDPFKRVGDNVWFPPVGLGFQINTV
jgi:hypothetical protein